MFWSFFIDGKGYAPKTIKIKTKFLGKTTTFYSIKVANETK